MNRSSPRAGAGLLDHVCDDVCGDAALAGDRCAGALVDELADQLVRSVAALAPAAPAELARVELDDQAAADQLVAALDAAWSTIRADVAAAVAFAGAGRFVNASDRAHVVLVVDAVAALHPADVLCALDDVEHRADQICAVLDIAWCAVIHAIGRADVLVDVVAEYTADRHYQPPRGDSTR